MDGKKIAKPGISGNVADFSLLFLGMRTGHVKNYYNLRKQYIDVTFICLFFCISRVFFSFLFAGIAFGV